jgi:hypothetical protein
MTHIVRLSDYRREARKRKGRVYFDRGELSRILSAYARRVASGDWRDYAIDHTIGMALFSIFRHTSEQPVFTVVKAATPRGPEYSVFDSRGRIARSADLAEVLTALPPPLSLVQ